MTYRSSFDDSIPNSTPIDFDDENFSPLADNPDKGLAGDENKGIDGAGKVRAGSGNAEKPKITPGNVRAGITDKWGVLERLNSLSILPLSC